jgi:hypothetical protein
MALPEATKAAQDQAEEMVKHDRADWRRLLKVLVGLFVFLVAVVCWPRSATVRRDSSATAGTSQSHLLEIAPCGRSGRVKIPDGRKIDVDGEDIRVINVYANLGECIRNCPPGARYMVVENLNCKNKQWNYPTWKVR